MFRKKVKTGCLYTILDGDLISYEILKPTKAGWIVYDKEQDVPHVFNSKDFDKFYFSTPAKAIANAAKNLNSYIEKCEKDLKKIKKIK